jgi:hypothetical protein
MTDSLESQFAELRASGWDSESKQVAVDGGGLVTQITFTRGEERKRLTIGIVGLSVRAFWESFDGERWTTETDGFS